MPSKPPVHRPAGIGDRKRPHPRSAEAQQYRRWYKTAAWQKLRWSILVRDLFTCQMCKRIEADTSQIVADHKTPHHGDKRLFWDAGNIQTLCKDCHDSVKQRAEKSGTVIGCDESGWPLDPEHPWWREG